MSDMVESGEESVSSRLNHLETRATKMEAQMSAVATREDLHKEISGQTWKLVTFVSGFGSSLVIITYFIATHLSK